MRWALLALLFAGSANAAPIVPSFKTGTTTSHTESTTKITETIKSVNFATGYTYSASGTNIQNSGLGGITPNPTPTETQMVEGVTSSWTGLDLEQKPTWTIVNPGEAMQFTETYNGPGVTAVTDITRTTEITSVTDTTSVFGQ